ncbi:DUF2569 domain-containing protein [Novosphingobium sp. YJ-S2-02]|uniref:DUF2569 domain-containing protein n=1 Tax=Novosphingobium aureum TaxID=2792964 RepID=A0A931HAS4_9SPHN|nr:DUF2569 domain-containing protein [Novosphingobium aureum]MBH0112565.1 DUF2569 domain-containing protein [Novosphingobium aureum]
MPAQLIRNGLVHWPRLATVLTAMRHGFLERSRALANRLDTGIAPLLDGWIALVALVTLAKVALAGPQAGGIGASLAMAFPFLLAAMAPVLGYRIAAAAFPRGTMYAQPRLRLARYGLWRDLDALGARNHRYFGPAGILVSLIAGILLNVPFRTGEFLLAMPAMPVDAPQWASTMLFAMTFDLVVMNFLYMVCFVMALRAVPWFPRMLGAAWLIDICMQLSIAHEVANAPHLPEAVIAPLLEMLDGNLHKVLISIGLWLPYLILSERVNVTYRHRVRA